MTVDTQVDRDRVYEGLDAAHTPRLFVPERFVEEGSRKLELLAGRALLDSQMFQDRQFDVIWFGRNVASRFFRTDIFETGFYPDRMAPPASGPTDRFLVNPGFIQNLPSGARGYPDLIEMALENGAGVFSPADLARSYKP